MPEITIINNSSRTADNCPAEIVYYQENGPVDHGLSDEEFNKKRKEYGAEGAKAMGAALRRMHTTKP